MAIAAPLKAQKPRVSAVDDLTARPALVDAPSSALATYSSGNLALAIPITGEVSSPISIPVFGAIVDLDLKVRINHTFDADLDISLRAPDGTTFQAFDAVGDTEDNFGSGASNCNGTPTTLDDSAATFIEAGIAPFAGSYRPKNPLAVFNGKETSGTWTLRINDHGAGDVGTLYCWQLTIRRRTVTSDFGAERTVPAVWRPGTPGTTIYRKLNSAPPGSFNVGQAGDIPIPGDYGFGNRVDAMFRPATGGWLNALGPGAIAFGINGDIPVPADYGAHASNDIAVFRPSNGTWYLRNIGFLQWGTTGDIPVPADYNGDGAADIAVFRPSNGTWYINNVTAFAWGAPDDIPVPADYDGDGRVDACVFRPSNGTWYIASLTGTTAVTQWGTSGDIPVPGDYDGDGRDDIAVWRPSDGHWYIYRVATLALGQAGDVPMAKRPSYPGYPY
jgi:subtilisin-like proprotein convertase family protein